MAPATSITMRISSEIRLVDLVHEVAQRVAELVGYVPEEALNVGLAVREAVINAIVHGNQRDAARPVEVGIDVQPDGTLSARVRDRGEGFDPSAAPDPTHPGHRLEPSGRGLMLIRAFVDEVEFNFRHGRGLELILTKKMRSEKRAS